GRAGQPARPPAPFGLHVGRLTRRGPAGLHTAPHDASTWKRTGQQVACHAAGECGMPAGAPYPILRRASELILQRIRRPVDALVPTAAPAPLRQLDLDTVLGVGEKDLLEPGGQRLVWKAGSNLVVDAERALVEVGRSDRAPHAVDRHDLLVQQRLLIL